MLVASEESWVLEVVGEAVGTGSVVVVLASDSVADEAVDLGRGSKENVGLPCGTETVVVF